MTFHNEKIGRLVLGFKVGESFFVGHEKFTLEKIDTPMRYKVMHHGALDTIKTIDSAHKEEVLPDVHLSAGKSNEWDVAKIVIEAPESVKLLRQKLYEKQYGAGAGGA